jgi:hypothetical protein
MSLKAETHPTNVEWVPPLLILESLNPYNPANSLGNPPLFLLTIIYIWRKVYAYQIWVILGGIIWGG